MLFGAWEAIQKGPINIGWYNGLIVGSSKLKKTRFDVTLLEQEAWKA